MENRLIPSLWTSLKEGYSLPFLMKDSFAGLILGILSIPMAISFAIASGARPEQGIFTAVIAGFLVSLLGGSRFQIAGPTGAFVILVNSTIQQFGYEGLAIATLLAGIFLCIMGVFRFGAFIKFIPYPVTVGFTSGLALVIFTGQIPDLFGIKFSSFPPEFHKRWALFFNHLLSISPISFLIALGTILIILYWPRFSKRIPGAIVAILITTAFVQIFHIPTETIKDRFGSIPSSLPSPSLPSWDIDLILRVIPSAIAIALLAGIESLLSAVVADGMTGRRHRSNMELFAQGIANIGSIFFCGIPATGAIARTATNIKNGAQTPIAGIINALVLLLILFFFGNWVSWIPMATLAAILAIIAYNMSEWRHFKSLFSSPKPDIAVLLTTFFLTVFVDLVTAIEVGIILATFLFLNTLVKSSKHRFLKNSLSEEEDKEDPFSISSRNIPDEIEVFEIFGPLFFAATENFRAALNNINRTPKVLILRMRHVSTIDASGIRALEELLAKTQKEKTILFFSGIHPSLKEAFSRSGFLDKIGKNNCFSNIDSALAQAHIACNLPPPESSPPSNSCPTVE
jgi:sulfate permease, SulP family